MMVIGADSNCIIRDTRKPTGIPGSSQVTISQDANIEIADGLRLRHEGTSEVADADKGRAYELAGL